MRMIFSCPHGTYLSKCECGRASGIYRIVGKDQCSYIGSTSKFSKRARTHCSTLVRGDHGNPGLQREYWEYGGNHFVFEILEFCDRGVLLEREQFCLDLYRGLGKVYNCGTNAAKPWTGIIPTAEHREKISIATKGRNNSYAISLARSHESREKRAFSLSGGKVYHIISPTGEEHHGVINLKGFADSHGLHHQVLNLRINKGLPYKGWTGTFTKELSFNANQ